MKIKAREIAKELGVSPSTVSLVINNRPGVSEKTRKIVLERMKEKGFFLTLEEIQTKSKNGNIRFIVYNSVSDTHEGTPFFAGILEGAEREARKNGYNLAISCLDKARDTIKDTAELIKFDKPDGVVLLATELDTEDIEFLGNTKIPFVVVDNILDSFCYNCVGIDNRNGAWQAVSYLIKCGHKRIGYLRSAKNLNNFHQRKDGMKLALRQEGLILRSEDIYSFDTGITGCFDNLLQNLTSGDVPTAFFADNDNLAIDVIKIIKSAGFRIPEDISIIGFDDDKICQVIEPRLTTMHVHKDVIGASAIKVLVDDIENNNRVNAKYLILTDLIIRESVLDISVKKEV